MVYETSYAEAVSGRAAGGVEAQQREAQAGTQQHVPAQLPLCSPAAQWLSTGMRLHSRAPALVVQRMSLTTCHPRGCQQQKKKAEQDFLNISALLPGDICCNVHRRAMGLDQLCLHCVHPSPETCQPRCLLW